MTLSYRYIGYNLYGTPLKMWSWFTGTVTTARFYMVTISISLNNDDALQRRHNGRDDISNHQPHNCLLNRLFRHRLKKTSKLRVTGLCAGNSPDTDRSRLISRPPFSVEMRHTTEPRCSVVCLRCRVCAGRLGCVEGHPCKWPVTRKMFPFDDVIMEHR